MGTDKSYAFTRSSANHPVNICSEWKTYNKAKKSWDPDTGVIKMSPGVIKMPPVQLPDDNLTLSEIKSLGEKRSNEITAGKNEAVVWKVILSGFKVQKLNSVYLLQNNLINGRPHFKSSSGRIVLWWFDRRKFWMISPVRLVGSDQSYACIEYDTGHPKDVEGMWQVYDRTLKKFVEDDGARIHPGVAERISMAGFLSDPELNGVFIETMHWRSNRPSFRKHDMRQHCSLVLFYRNSTKKWCVTRDNEIGSTPIVTCEEPGMHPRDFKNRKLWKDALDNILQGVVT